MTEIISVVVNVVMCIVLGIIGLVKLSGHKSAATRMDALEKDIKEHVADDTPHVQCAKHTVILQTVSATLIRLEGKMDTLDVRVYNLVRNGGKPPESFLGEHQ